ncbi:DUF4123 domain-containing protein [Sphingomonas mucosissima]|uniref:Putative deoxyribonuclease RhsC n=1 Tax=Sphingomonas mucosissima TaxID=370959 RepID=A0A245ZMJ0_9SPHN|nr:DUF4123 domain-containing protein [Sphingomonas mucosissima]OWK30950.1 putative deoxyribonuclease RhsC [Sphingomonas mucosissima]
MTARPSSAAEPPPPAVRIRPAESALVQRAAEAGHLYAVVDPCVDDGAIGWLRALGEDRASSLYIGEAQQNYGDKAPHVVRVDPALLATLPARFGDSAWGCLLVSDAPPGRVRQHLRSWLQVRSPEGEMWLFRFWDPRTLPIFLRASTAAELDAFFGPLAAFAMLSAAGQTFVAERAVASPTPRRRVGERSTISPAQIAALRRVGLGDRLAASFANTKLEARRETGSGDVLLRAPDGGVSRIHLADDGQIGGTTSPSGRRWRTVHRADGKLATMTTPSGAHLAIGYDAAGNVETVARNGKDRFRAEHDRHGRMERVQFPDGTDARIAYASQGYAALADPSGEMIEARRDRIGRTERFEYHGQQLATIIDGNGNRTEVKRDDSDRPAGFRFADGREESYRYDPAGHLAAIVRGGGARLDVTCDANGRVRLLRTTDGEEAAFDYDEAGRMIAATNAAGTVVWHYDEIGRVVEERSADATVGYDYDEVGLVGLTYPDGSTIHYVRDRDQRLEALCDWTGGWHRLEYAPDDTGWRKTSPDGTIVTTMLDSIGLLASQQVEHNGKLLWQSRHVHDDEDRLHERHDSRLGTTGFDYDAEGQLTRHVRSNGAVDEFSYDGNGNRTHSPAGSAQFDATDRIVEQGTSHYTHDDNGSMVARVGPDSAWRFAYDGFGRLITAEDATGRRIGYGYDALGRRLWKRVTGDGQDRTTRFIWAGEQVIREVSDGAAPRDYCYWPQTYTPLLLRDGDQLYHFHCDQTGTPQRLTATDGSIAWESDGDAFGNTCVLHATVAQPLRLPGQYADEEFGLTLHYNRFRFYDPALGRYISPDPIGFAGGLNLYTYAGGDPVNRADPLGLWWKAALTIAAGVVAAVAVVALAPITGPLLIIAAGAAAGAAASMMNEALNQETFCASCILLAGIRGAAVGALAALPVAWLPATASLAAFFGLSALSGFTGYVSEWALSPGMEFNWQHAAIATGVAAATGGLGRVAAGAFRPRPPAVAPPPAPRLPQDLRVNPTPPAPLPLRRPIGQSPTQNAAMQSDIAAARAAGATDFRVNQQQVNASGQRVGTNRPDLQYTDANGRRVYIEYDTSSSTRGPGHQTRINSNDPSGQVILKEVN